MKSLPRAQHISDIQYIITIHINNILRAQRRDTASPVTRAKWRPCHTASYPMSRWRRCSLLLQLVLNFLCSSHTDGPLPYTGDTRTVRPGEEKERTVHHSERACVRGPVPRSRDGAPEARGEVPAQNSPVGSLERLGFRPGKHQRPLRRRPSSKKGKYLSLPPGQVNASTTFACNQRGI